MENTNEKQKVSFKEKVQNWFKGFKLKLKKTSDYLDENPEKAGALFGGLVTLGIGLYAMVAGAAAKEEEKCRIEDEYIGSYWVTDHPLTNKELMELNNRMLESQYYNLGKALDECGYLKDEKKR